MLGSELLSLKEERFQLHTKTYPKTSLRTKQRTYLHESAIRINRHPLYNGPKTSERNG